MRNNISIVLSESELTEMLAIVKSFERDGACIVLNGPIQPNSIDSILHYGQSDVYAGNGGLIKKAGEYFQWEKEIELEEQKGEWRIDRF